MGGHLMFIQTEGACFLKLAFLKLNLGKYSSFCFNFQNAIELKHDPLFYSYFTCIACVVFLWRSLLSRLVCDYLIGQVLWSFSWVSWWPQITGRVSKGSCVYVLLNRWWTVYVPYPGQHWFWTLLLGKYRGLFPWLLLQPCWTWFPGLLSIKEIESLLGRMEKFLSQKSCMPQKIYLCFTFYR